MNLSLVNLLAALLVAAVGIVIFVAIQLYNTMSDLDQAHAELDQARRERDGHRYRAARYREMHRRARTELVEVRRWNAEVARCQETHVAELDDFTTGRWAPTNRPLGIHPPYPINPPYRSN